MAHKRRPSLTKEERRQNARNTRQQMKNDIHQHPILFTTYVVLRVLVIAVMVLEIFNREYYDVFLCGLTLVLFMIPSFVERRLHIDVPNTLEIIILLFIFSAEILGEIQEYYLIFPFWDTMLHTINGFLMAAIGIAMVDILNRSRKFKVRLSPAFVALVAFCFSMTVGVVWEFFEYGMDYFFHTDMQKDFWITSLSSVSLNAEGHNVPIQVAIDSVVVNGQQWPAYLDIGLHDTMKDLLVNFVGAVIFSIIGALYIMGRGKGRFAPRFIPRLKSDELPAKGEQPGLLEPIPLSDTSSASEDSPKDCVFCKIVQGKAPCYKIYEDEYTLAILDTAGDVEGHTLVIPKEHVETLIECRDETAVQTLASVRLIAEHYVKDCGFDGVNVLSASGKRAQQSVPHLHFHIIPRKAGDKLNIWPALGKDNHDLKEVWERLRFPASEPGSSSSDSKEEES